MGAIKARVISYRRGPRSQNPNQVILSIEGVADWRKASRYIGCRVVYRDRYGNVYKGRIVKVHGRNDLVRAVFKPNLPGQAIGCYVDVFV